MGWFEGEHRAAGFPFHAAGARGRCSPRQIEIIHRQWTEDELSTSTGAHYGLEGCRALPEPVQTPQPPIDRRRHGEARHARCRPSASPTSTTRSPRAPDRVRERHARADRAACERAGRDPGDAAALGHGRPRRRRDGRRRLRRSASAPSPGSLTFRARDEMLDGPRRGLADRDAGRGRRADPRASRRPGVSPHVHAGLGRRCHADAGAGRGGDAARRCEYASRRSYAPRPKTVGAARTPGSARSSCSSSRSAGRSPRSRRRPPSSTSTSSRRTSAACRATATSTASRSGRTRRRTSRRRSGCASSSSAPAGSPWRRPARRRFSTRPARRGSSSTTRRSGRRSGSGWRDIAGEVELTVAVDCVAGRGPVGRARSAAARGRTCSWRWTSACTARARRAPPARSRSRSSSRGCPVAPAGRHQLLPRALPRRLPSPSCSPRGTRSCEEARDAFAAAGLRLRAHLGRLDAVALHDARRLRERAARRDVRAARPRGRRRATTPTARSRSR